MYRAEEEMRQAGVDWQLTSYGEGCHVLGTLQRILFVSFELGVSSAP